MGDTIAACVPAPLTRDKAHVVSQSPKVAPVGAKNGASGLQMHSLMMRYDTVVKKLNEYRKGGVGYGLIERFMEASKGVGTDVVRASSRLNLLTQSGVEIHRDAGHLEVARFARGGEGCGQGRVPACRDP